MEIWERLLIALVLLLFLFWLRPGVKAAFEASREEKKDWPGVLIPLGLVALFIVLLLAAV